MKKHSQKPVSIVGQSWQDFEWIVVDGGSTDGTLDVLNEYRDRIDVLISEPDNGIYNVMNKGIARARGEWLNFMNGGDAFCDKTVLEQVFGGGSSRDGADVLYGDMLCRGKVHKMPVAIDADFFINGSINHQSSFIRAALFREQGGYNENYRVLSDVEKWIVWMKAGRVFRHLPVVVADFDAGGVSSSGQPADKGGKGKNHRPLLYDGRTGRKPGGSKSVLDGEAVWFSGAAENQKRTLSGHVLRKSVRFCSAVENQKKYKIKVRERRLDDVLKTVLHHN